MFAFFLYTQAIISVPKVESLLSASNATQVLTPTPPPPPASCCLLPALTPLELMLTQDVSSKTAKVGDAVKLQLAAPIIVNGVTLIPQGTPATAEVIDVQHTGFGGKAGSIILAARFLMYDNKKISLRSFQLESIGKDNTNIAAATGVAMGVFSMVITGTNANISNGTHASAKIREDVILSIINSIASASSPIIQSNLTNTTVSKQGEK